MPLLLEQSITKTTGLLKRHF